MPMPQIVDETESILSLDDLESRRVLIVGAKPNVEGVVSMSWQEFGDDPASITDFSLVILVLDTFEILVNPALANTQDALIERYSRFLKGPSTELVVVGWTSKADRLLGNLSLGIQFQAESGQYITDRARDFGAYLHLVESFSWILTPIDTPQGVSQSVLLKGSGRDILSVAVRSQEGSRVVVLPAPTAVEMDDALELLLTQYYALPGQVREPPEWVAGIHLPTDTELIDELAGLEAAIEPLEERRAEAANQLGLARRPLASLYESGPTLEGIVRDLLRALGAEVVDPANTETDDGTLTTPSGDKVVLEIKGRSGPIKVVDARQLSDWVRLRMFEDDESEPEQWKGLLIGNDHLSIPVGERPDAHFAPNCVRVSKRDDHALLTTSQIIDALREQQSDRFDDRMWWSQVVATSGVCNF